MRIGLKNRGQKTKDGLLFLFFFLSHFAGIFLETKKKRRMEKIDKINALINKHGP